MAELKSLIVNGVTRLNNTGYAKQWYAEGVHHTAVDSDSYVVLAGGGYTSLSNLANSHSHPYLPLAGGTMTSPGIINWNKGTKEILHFATDDSNWISGLGYSWSSSTSIAFWGKNANTSFVFAPGITFPGTNIDGCSANDAYAFQVYGGSGTNAKVRTAGNLLVKGSIGIGTDSPSYKLHINGGIYGTSYLCLGQTYIYNLGSYIKSGNSTGTIKITLPFNTSEYDMPFIRINIYEYSAQGASQIIFGGHNWTSGYWHNGTYSVIGNYNKGVRAGNDGTNFCILLGTTTTTWSYVNINVEYAQPEYISTSWWPKWLNRCTFNLITDETGFVNSPNGYINQSYSNAKGFIKSGSNDNYVLLGGGSHTALSNLATSSHTHQIVLGATTITIPAPGSSNTYTYITGPFSVYTDASANKAFTIGRASQAEAVKHWVDDSYYHIDYTNDETESAIKIQLSNTDTESPHNPSQASTFITWLNSAGQFYPNSNNTGSVGITNNRWNTIYGNNLYATTGIFANTAGSGTAGGIGLYGNDYTYGLFFRGTGTYGKLGKVQDTWATYFTMSNDASRGWIFRSGSTNYASISARGEAYFSAIGKDGYIPYPNGGTYIHQNSTLTGAIKIALPTAVFKSRTMMKFTVEIYNYSTGTSYTYVIGGYNYNTPSWVSVFAYSLRQGTNDKGNLRVRFGNNGSREIIWIGETNTTWSYPQIFVKDLCLGHTNNEYYKWAQGWEVSVTNSFDTVQTYIDNPAVNYKAQNADYATSAGNADTVDNEHAVAFAHRQTWNNMIHSGNEYTFVSPQYSGVVYINYRTSSGATDGNITQYNMSNGKAGYANVASSGFIKNGYDNTYVLQAGGGAKLESSLSVAYAVNAGYATNAGNADTVDNIHASGLLTAASLGSSGNSTTLSVTVGGTTKTGSVTVPYATSAGNSDTVDGYHISDNYNLPYKNIIDVSCNTSNMTTNYWYVKILINSTYQSIINGKMYLYANYSNYMTKAELQVFGYYLNYTYKASSYNADVINGIASVREGSNQVIWLRLRKPTTYNGSVPEKGELKIYHNNINTATAQASAPSGVTFKDTLGSDGQYIFSGQVMGRFHHIDHNNDDSVLLAGGGYASLSNLSSSHNHGTSKTIWGQTYVNANGTLLDVSGDITTAAHYMSGYLYMKFGGSWLSTIDNDGNGPIFGHALATNNRRVYFVGSPAYICGGSYTNYNNGITVTSDNKVGIGITSPSQKLHINGGLLAITSNSKTLTIGANNASWYHFSCSDSSPFYFSNSAAFNGDVYPYVNNSYTLGTSDKRWKNVYGVLGNYSGQVTVSVATGTAPFSITSTTCVSNLNVDLLDGEHAYQIRAFPKNNSSVLFSSLPFLENNIQLFSSTPAVSMENAPEGLCFGPISSYKTYTSDYIAVEPGEILYGEIWAYRASGASGTAGTLYYGVQRFDRNKKAISANNGLNSPNNGYFVASGVTVATDGVWHKYSATQTVPTSHTAYSGSDGKGTYYIKIYVLVNYSSGTIPTYIGRILLKRLNKSGENGYIATTAVQSTSTAGQNITGTGNITPNSANSYTLGGSTNGFSNVYASTYNIMHSSNGTEIRGTIAYNNTLIGSAYGIKLATNSNGPNFQVDATNVYLNVSASSGLYVYGGSYYSQIRPESSSWASFYTNSSKYYFSKPIYVTGEIWQYNTNYGLASDGLFYAKGVYANRAGASTYGGVSLYSNSDPMTYGIAFRGTGTSSGEGGKYQGIQGDWATYFTMNTDSGRGWMFRAGSNNLIAIDNQGSINRFRTFRCKLPSITNAAKGWYRIAKISSLDAYFNGTLYMTGSWSSGDPSQALISFSNINGNYYLTQLSGKLGSVIQNVRLVKINGATAYLDVYQNFTYSSSTTMAEQYFLLTGNFKETETYEPTTPTDSSIDSGGTQLAIQTITGHVLTDENYTSYVYSKTQSDNRYVLKAGDTMTGHLKMSGTKNLGSAWDKGIIAGADGHDKVVLTYLASSTNGAVIGAHNSTLSAWALLNISGTELVFRNNETERMRLNSSGNFGIGTSSPSYKLHVNGDTYTTGWSRAASGFYIHDQGVHYTHSSTNGEIYLSKQNVFNFTTASWTTLYINYGNSKYGTTYVTDFVWNNGSSSGYANHTLGLLKSTGVGTTKYIAYPSGGQYTNNSGSKTGAIAIYFPDNNYGSWGMIKMTIDIYNYATGTSATYVVGGHNESKWYNVSAYCISHSSNSVKGNLKVRFCTVNQKYSIYIGETDTTWSYPQVTIRNITIGYSGDYSKYVSGWSIDFVTTFPSTIDASVSNTATNYAVRDMYNGNAITFAYSQGGFSSNPTWVAAWNGYNLTYVSPSKLNVNYATSAGSATSAEYAEYLNNYSVADSSIAKKDLKVKWFAQINSTASGTTGYAGTNAGFPTSNNANGILWLGTHSGNYGGQIGISSNGSIYYRFIVNGSFPTTANGGSWSKIITSGNISPSLLISGDTIAVQAGGATSSYITVPYATESKYLRSMGNYTFANISTDIPVNKASFKIIESGGTALGDTQYEILHLPWKNGDYGNYLLFGANNGRVGVKYKHGGLIREVHTSDRSYVNSSTGEGVLLGTTITYVSNADKVDGKHLAAWTYPISPRDFANGTRIDTDIIYKNASGDAFYIEISGDMYGSLGSMHTLVQGYIYNNTIINYSVNNLGRVRINHLYAMLIGDYLVFWFARIGYWQSFRVGVYRSSAGNYWENHCTSITNSAEPVDGVTKKIDLCTDGHLFNNAYLDSTVANATNAGNADTVDGYHANRFAFTYNSANYGVSSSVTVNDLVTNGVSNASHGMIYSSTDNPIGSSSWIHVWSQQWTIGTTSSWVAQIAVGTQAKTGLYYRTNGSGSIVGKTWTRVYDDNYHPQAVNADTVDNVHANQLVPRQHSTHFYPFVGSSYGTSAYYYKVTLPWAGYTSSSNAWLMTTLEIVLGGSYGNGNNGRIYLQYYFLKTSSNTWQASNVAATAIGYRNFDNGVKILYNISNPGVFYIKANTTSGYNSIGIENVTANDTAQNFDFRNTTIEAIAANAVDSSATGQVTMYHSLTTQNLNYTETGKNYKVKADSFNNLYVNVPWTDNDHNDKVNQSGATADVWRGVILGNKYSTTANSGIEGSVTDVVYTSNKITFNPSRGALALTYVNDIKFKYTKVDSSVYTTSFRAHVFGESNSNYSKFSIVRFNSPCPNEGYTWSSGIAFQGIDTQGMMIVKYDSPGVCFSGGSTANQSWWMKITGANHASYDLSNFVTSSHTHYWANVQVSSTSNDNTTPTFKSISIKAQNNDNGIYFNGGSWINNISKSVIFRDATLRFGGSSWDWDVWAGLSYDSTNKRINIGIPDGTIFTANSAKTDGTIRTVNSKIEVFPSGNSNYGEGIRIHTASNGWTSLIFCGSDNTGFNGTSANSWSLHTYTGNFYINKNASSTATNSRAMATSTGWTFGNTSTNSYALNAASFICDSWVRTKGSTGWYNESYGGGWYMSDSNYIRVYSSKRVYNDNTSQYAFYTEGGFTGNSLYLTSSRSRFISLSSTLNHIPPFSITGLKSFGYPVYTDPEFASGYNSVSSYNNTSGGAVTITREASTESANSSGYQLKIVTNGTASPGAGGFVQTISSRANAVFVQIFRAKIPVGWSVNTASNSMGASYTDNWLTEQAGTGKWEWYARIVHCGSSGSFSSGGHVYLTGTSNTSVTWYLSYCNVIDITKGNYDGLRTRYSDNSGNADNIYVYSAASNTAANGFNPTTFTAGYRKMRAVKQKPTSPDANTIYFVIG